MARSRIMVGIPFDGGSRDVSDYRPVPSSDRGNDGYHDRGQLGSYATNDGEPWGKLSGAKYETGYGCDMADVARGYSAPGVTQDPAYDLANYKDRYSEPKVSDLVGSDSDGVSSDWEFRSRNRRSQGFLTRSRYDTNRG